MGSPLLPCVWVLLGVGAQLLRRQGACLVGGVMVRAHESLHLRGVCGRVSFWIAFEHTCTCVT